MREETLRPLQSNGVDIVVESSESRVKLQVP